MTMDLLKIYAGENRVNLWIEVFGEDTLNAVIPTLDIGDYTQEEHVPTSEYARINYYEKKGFICFYYNNSCRNADRYDLGICLSI